MYRHSHLPELAIFWKTKMATNRVIRKQGVLGKLGVCNSTLYQWIADGKFPAPIPLGERSVGWIEAEVDQWIEQRKQARNVQGESA